MTRPAKRPQPLGSEIFTGTLASPAAGTDLTTGDVSLAPVSAGTSRATPSTDRQSARFGVSFKVRSLSSSSRYSRKLRPTGASAGSARSPQGASESASWGAESSMPFDSTPRSVVAFTVMPGSSAPASASGAFIPAATFGAPQTTSSRRPFPASPLHPVSRSAPGCFRTSSTRATTTVEKTGATGVTVSTSTPDIVSRCASSSVVNAGSTIVRSQLSGNCMGSGASGELAQEPQVAVEEQPEVVDPVPEHRQPLEPRAEREADMALRIEPEVAHHVRMHLAGAGDLEPAAVLERHVDLGGGLGEREERRTEAHLQVVGLEEPAEKVRVDALQVREADAAVDPQPFDLVEHRRVRRVAVHAISAPGRDDLDRRRVSPRVTHLHRTRVRAQEERLPARVMALDVKGVVHRPRGVVLRLGGRGG